MVTVKKVNGNGKLKERLYAAGLIASLLFISIDKVVVPTVNSGKLADAVNYQAQQIARLEERVIAVYQTIDRMAKKLDEHIAR